MNDSDYMRLSESLSKAEQEENERDLEFAFRMEEIDAALEEDMRVYWLEQYLNNGL